LFVPVPLPENMLCVNVQEVQEPEMAPPKFPLCMMLSV